MCLAETILENVVRQKNMIIVGEPSAGTDGNTASVHLPGGAAVIMTGLRVLHFDGTRLHGIGVLPSVACAPTIAGIAEGKDETLDCAIRALTK